MSDKRSVSETWADAQFNLLEEAYNEIPIEAKARIEQLESSLDEVAEKWAIAQVNYEDCARKNSVLLEMLDRWYSFAIGNGLDQSCADYEEWCALERATLEQLGR